MNNITAEQWHNIWEVVHIIGKTYMPTPEIQDAFICFFDCLCDLLPDVSARNNLRSFMQQTPVDQYLDCNNKAFEWTWKLHNYINMIKKRQGYKISPISLETAYDNYQLIDKRRWGNAFWFLIHFIFANIPTNSSNSLDAQTKISCKAFIVCIRYLLPCRVECGNHMKAYLSKVNIDYYLNSPQNLFRWSWEFHNAVNTRLKHQTYDFEPALMYYTIPKSSFQVIDETAI